MGRNVTKSPDPEKLLRQLCLIAHQRYSVDDALRGEKWDRVRLRVVSAKCTGCQLCVTACVGAHDRQNFSNHLARLNVDMQGLGQHKVYYCTLCKKCIDICPTGALCWHTATGAVELVVEKCTACGKCVEICPTQVILQSDSSISLNGVELPWYPIICDLCGGDPACARICPTEAITISERGNFR